MIGNFKLSLGLFLVATLLVTAQEQPIQADERATVRAMLSDIKDDIKNNYYDPKFHGVDIDARYSETADRISKATSLNQAFGMIAWFMEGLQDSHTAFIPPPRPFVVSRGWRMQMIGERCYVTAVKPGSDAEKQGLAPGDQIISINGLTPTRADLRKIEYLFGILRPQPGFTLELRDLSQKQRTVDVAFQIHETKRVVDIRNWGESQASRNSRWMRDRRSTVIGDTIIWKFPNFDIDEGAADDIIGSSKQHKSMIVDLRGNPGGSVATLQHFIRHFFDHDVKMYDVQTRKKTEAEIAKWHRPVFSGRLVVLIDSRSASASEIFARLVQLEKRGTVIGDRSAGEVMEAEFFQHSLGSIRAIFFGAEITRANLIMTDGKSLENQGVSPDTELLPTADDLRSSRDPVLAQALSSLGQRITPEEAGQLFPIQWPDE